MDKGKASILIVDDDEETLKSFSSSLSSKYKCATATSAEAAAKLLANRRFDVVITDVWTPGRAGLELCALIKSRYPETAVLITSASPDVKEEAEAGRRRAFEYMGKPFPAAHLMASVTRALRHQALIKNS
jgi:DNA-binding NtrC family response regulator